MKNDINSLSMDSLEPVLWSQVIMETAKKCIGVYFKRETLHQCVTVYFTFL